MFQCTGVNLLTVVKHCDTMAMKKIVLFKSASEDYQEAFKANNYDVIFIEPLEFLSINMEELSQKLQEDYCGLIITSPRAVEAVSKCWDPSKFVLWSMRKTYTVGEATSRKIKLMLGLDAIGMESGNAEALSQIIIKENSAQSKFLFPCGNLRSETIPDTLKANDIEVDALTVYETRENEKLRSDLMHLDSLQNNLSGMVFFSPSGCEYIHRQLQTFCNQLTVLPHFAIGNSTAQRIVNLGLDIAGVAARPKADSIVESVQNYFDSVAVSS